MLILLFYLKCINFRQLSDVTKDGALSLEEFNVAMHLVVLRRNNIPLPDTLPPSLIPTTISVNSVVQPPVPPPREENSPEQSSVSAEPYGNKQVSVIFSTGVKG